MDKDDVQHTHETRGSLRKLLLQMDAYESEGVKSLSADRPEKPGDDLSDRDSILSSLESIHSLDTPSSSVKPTRSSPLPVTKCHRPDATTPPLVDDEPQARINVSSSKPTSAPYTTQPKNKAIRKPAVKIDGRKKNSGEASSASGDILGPFAHELEQSTQDRLRREAYALRDTSGKVCPLQMAQLFWANSTLGAPYWPELYDGRRTIENMRKDSLDLGDLRERREREEVESEEKEKKRLAMKRKYGRIRENGPLQDDDCSQSRKSQVRSTSVPPD
ncbi:hypothetical protein E4U17_007072 [Claviceps sp. LM77 group G4]|nr:hypothetical protein E4U17_007072 [Claviceps sp. LM77 group G4]KAG6078786.1 hypothetical protein E4U16_001431 [Claviceps sp. LM84 group G4]